MSDAKLTRPLSPHLTVYRFRPTMAVSIIHRITGGALYFGTILVVWWLAAAASGPEAFAWASWFFGSILGRLVLFVYSWVLIHHMLGGIRHFIWDTGHGLAKETSTKLALANVAGSAGLTVLLWLAVAIF
ncbi:succinate dehydrogenase membrane anchor subunit [Aureimonas endophytica]|uniref:Succinate dehydrogenase cytochrome b556 subunit n=1 Tax=Aureimonas endophytica TaxID=2027858 RepID=A0A916ZHQ8_9HYPH|nr:succinate dehydrogenase, cytochrome b556 subunit [Aureimonas endophytica]GGD97302.1 succinate dehydrogenase membrane anchor subunit [Aureimonas endophytica]